MHAPGGIFDVEAVPDELLVGAVDGRRERGVIGRVHGNEALALSVDPDADARLEGVGVCIFDVKREAHGGTDDNRSKGGAEFGTTAVVQKVHDGKSVYRSGPCRGCEYHLISIGEMYRMCPQVYT